MQAIILAAGMGRRIQSLTQNNTKCMLDVNGKKLIERALDALQLTGIDKVIVVSGYKSDNLKKFLGSNYNGMDIVHIENKIYDETNNIYSLFLAKDYLAVDDTLLLESDLIFEPALIKNLMNNPYPNLAVVDKYESWMDGTVVTVDEKNNILDFISPKKFSYEDVDSYFKTVNIYKFSKDFSRNTYITLLESYCKVLGHNEYYEQVLKVVAMLDLNNLKAHVLTNEKWYEIDNIHDYKNAELIFDEGHNVTDKLSKRYGGYWRFPYIKDFCYLVNPYFPPKMMMDEIKASMETLISSYPSGLRIQKLLASQMFECREDFITVGNGAAELINAVMSSVEGRIGFILPTFNEYFERIPSQYRLFLDTEGKSFNYGSDDIIKLLEDASLVVIINPDNPTGHIMKRDEIIKILDFADANNKKVILDESFLDFANDCENHTLFTETFLNKYSSLIIIKSISKSYGVPGIRLGVLATSNAEIISKVESKLSIWNINSFGEYFLQIIQKFLFDYKTACKLIIDERERFYNELKNIEFLKIYRSEANYFLCEITNTNTAGEIVEKLLSEFKIFVKDLSGKRGFSSCKFLRVAIRNRADNDALVTALKSMEK